MPHSIEEVIQRLEKATGPDRKIDTEIYAKVVRRDLADSWTENYGFYEAGGDGKGWHYAPAYTASLDAAMTLVPEGLSWEVRASAVGDKGQARIWDYMRQPGFKGGRLPDGGDVVVTGCASPAIALCIASLKARAALQPDKESGNG